ncbi:MAG: hypothetical protein ACR2MU_02800 [Gaiellaceae bacterium]
MSSIAAPALTWPTVAELDAVVADGTRSSEAVELLGAQLLRLVDVSPSILEGVEPLTFETLGALTAFISMSRLVLESDLREIEQMERIRDSIALEVVS